MSRGHSVRVSRQTALESVAAVVTGALEHVFEGLDVVREAMIRSHADARRRGRPYTPAAMAELRSVILEQLCQRPFVDGMGALSAADLFVGRARHLEWWRQDLHDVRPLWLDFDPSSVDIYDYFEMEWFQRAKRDNQRCVYGPYVDSSGADHYIVTLTVPVVDETFLGVVGADVRMSLFEAEIAPALYDLEDEVVLVNSERRIVMTNSVRWIVGARLSWFPAVGDGTFTALAPVGADSGWVLAAAG